MQKFLWKPAAGFVIANSYILAWFVVFFNFVTLQQEKPSINCVRSNDRESVFRSSCLTAELGYIFCCLFSFFIFQYLNEAVYL